MKKLWQPIVSGILTIFLLIHVVQTSLEGRGLREIKADTFGMYIRTLAENFGYLLPLLLALYWFIRSLRKLMRQDRKPQ